MLRSFFSVSQFFVWGSQFLRLSISISSSSMAPKGVCNGVVRQIQVTKDPGLLLSSCHAHFLRSCGT